jgi:CRP/FNR family transcriptional regulator
MPSSANPDQLAGVDLFRNLPEQALRTVLAACSDLKCRVDDILFQAGDESRSLYVVLSGTVEIALEAPLTEETVAAELGPKAVFGESTFFHPAPHSTTARCLAATELLRLDRSEFDRLVQQEPQVGCQLAVNAADILGARLQNTDRWVSQLLQEQQDARIRRHWHAFREHMGHSFATPHGFIGLGAGWE